ncbi:hypothetical protein LCGC14_1217560 [marine sediment metagenome]|uniref:Uncharacterized protein n=1 Tax=marine sediment metagenome TaxID=412755 RepID=A0A0F9PGT2_9ZZZZ
MKKLILKHLTLLIYITFVLLFIVWTMILTDRAGAEARKPFSFRTSKEIFCFVWEGIRQGQRGLSFQCSSSMRKLREWLADDDKGPAWDWLKEPSKSNLMGAYKLEEVK